MNINNSSLWIDVPVASLCFGLGYIVSGTIYDKMSDLLAKFTLETEFKKNIASKPIPKNEYIFSNVGITILETAISSSRTLIIQNIALSILIAVTSKKIIGVLIDYGCPICVTLPLLVSSVITPIVKAF